MGRTLITVGLVLVAVGLLISLVGRLPGDIYIKGKHTSFYFPLTTCILVSALLTLGLWLFRR